MGIFIEGLSHAAIVAAFDLGTVQRALPYFGRIHDVQGEEIRGTLYVSAFVRGTEEYLVEIVIDTAPYGLEIRASCECPVGRQCKHAAAVALSLIPTGSRGRVPGAVPAWERDAQRLVEILSGADSPDLDRPVVGLQFDLAEKKSTRWEPRSYRLAMRPVQREASGKWVKSGISWRDVRDAHWAPTAAEPEVIEALAAVADAVPDALYGSALPVITDSRSAIWSALAGLERAGVDLVAGQRLESVHLITEPVEPRADLVARPDGGVHFAIGVDVEGDFVTAPDVVALGERPHGAAVLRPGARAARRRLQLVRFQRSVPPQMVAFLHGEGIAVPADARQRFADEFVPRISRLLPVRSPDLSVELASPEPPRLALHIDWRGTDAARVNWWWHYRVGTADREFGLRSAEGGAVRMPAAERELLDALELDDFAKDLLLDEDRRTLRSGRELRDFELVVFTGMVLPGLRDQVEVIEAGDAAEFYEVEEAPTFAFDVDEESSGVDWLDLNVRIEVGEHSIPLPDVLAALTAGAPFIVLPGGGYLRTDIPEFARLAELIGAASQLHESGGDTVRVGRTDLGTWAELDDLGEVDTRASEWVTAARRLRDFDGLPEIDPAGVISSLRDYQLTGFRWLAFLRDAGLGGILADDMGLGKTLQTLALIAHARADGADPFLVIAPTSVVQGWAREAATHTPGLTVRTVDALEGRRGSGLKDLADGADVLVTSYTLFRLEAEQYGELDWGGMILDEAQAIKNRQGKTYQAVRDLRAPFRLAITGTPFENRLMELYSLLSVVAPGLYPTAKAFTEQVSRPVEKEGDEVALARLRRRLKPFLLRRTKDIVAADLPPKQEQVLDVALSERHRAIYDTHLQRERQSVLGLVEDFDRNQVAIFAAITRMRMLSLDPALVDAEHEDVGSAKIDQLVEQLVELAAEGHRALVFSQFTKFLTRVKRRLDEAGVGWVYLDGRTRDRAKRIGEFKDGDAPVFVISLKAGGVGLTLTEADYVFVLDPWWNPAVEAQAVDRAHRIGQTKSVNVYRMVASDTIEGKVMELKARKAALFEQVVDGQVADISGLSADDVRGLFE